MSVPDFWRSPSPQLLIQEQKSLRSITEPYQALQTILKDETDLVDLADEKTDGDVLAAAVAQIDRHRQKLQALEVLAFFRHKDDARDAIFTIQSGAGGNDAMDWAEQLERMYLRWFDREGLKYEITDRLEGSEAGIHYSEIEVHGLYAFGKLKGERGVHRICHFSDFDSNGKKQTSFAAVDVVPVYAEIAVDLAENDLEIETFCSGGPGGQNVNKVASAVRIRHLPSGLMVKCQNHRSQIDNKKTAMEILASKIKQAQEDKRERRPKLEASFGHQTRTYVLQPYTLVKDHRTGFETGNASSILDGNLNDFMEAYLRQPA